MRIFVTVATHEQPFNRLMGQIESVARFYCKDTFIVQYGYSKPPRGRNIQVSKFLPYDKMSENYKESDVIITHAGPASIFDAFNVEKCPIIVPRYKDLNEHVNNHQVEFTKFLLKKEYSIIPVFRDGNILEALKRLKKNKQFVKMTSNKKCFNKKLDDIIKDLMK